MISFRRTVPEDLVTLEGWIARDSAHRGVEPGFWVTSMHGVSCYAVEGEAGPLMFVRQEAINDTAVLHIQFAPFDRKRIVEALKEGYPLVAEDARQRGFRRVRFDSQSPALIRVMIEMGFHAELVANL